MSSQADPIASPFTASNRPWWKGAAIYQIYPRSFADSNGDGVGDLAGINQRLGHVASLGVDGIWLSPFFASPMCDFGYDVSDYCAVDPIFGTLADFDALVAHAHSLGLRVIIDQVYSHTSDAHAWFSESRASRDNPRADWYVWADAKADGSPPNNWQSVFGGPAWTWDARRRQYYLHNFLRQQPQLNVHNPAVQDALLGVARFWLDRGVDGFRLDAINFAMHDQALRDNPPAPADGRRRPNRPFDFQLPLHTQNHPDLPRFVERIRALLDSYGAKFSVAEVGGEEPHTEMQRLTADNRRFDSAYGFDFLYADRLTPTLVAEALRRWPDTPGTGWPSWAFENHDAPRAASRWADADKAPALNALKLVLLASLRGNIVLYQGEELGLTQVAVPFEQLRDPEAIANWPHTLSRDGVRTPMPWRADAPQLGFSTGQPWLPIGPDHAALAVAEQAADADSMLALTRRLFALRKSSDALRDGAIAIDRADEAILCFRRIADGETLHCRFNMGAVAQGVAPPPGDWQILEAVGGATLTDLPPLGALIARAGTHGETR